MTVFEHDLFISYAHIDNQPLTSSQEGWISRFHVSLNALLSMRLGKKARIWRDDKLQGNDVFADEIVERFGSTAVLLSVLSPRYLKSRWCTREVTEFCARAERGGGMVVSNKARVFKVLKNPVSSEEALPPMMKSLLGYEFFTTEDGTPMELDALYGEKYAQDFNRKVNKLAYEIAQLLEALEAADDVPGETGLGDAAGTDADTDAGTDAMHATGADGATVREAAGATGRCIYLAQCGFDRREDRERLEAELTRLGHEVLPDRQLPHDEAGYVAAVDEALARADLSIHLVGVQAGAVADGPSGTPLPMLQNELAARRSASGLRRLIGLPEGTRSDDARQQGFIDTLHDDPEAQRGADLIAGGLESLKRAVFAELERGERTTSAEPLPGGPSSADDGCTIVHLLCTGDDRKDAVPLRRFLKSRGVEVTLPAFDGEAAELRAANRRLLARCDAVLLWYGHGDEAWKRTVDTELRKLPAFRDGGAPPVHTCLATPRTPDKDDLIDMDEPNLVDALEGFEPARLAALLEDVGVATESS